MTYLLVVWIIVGGRVVELPPTEIGIDQFQSHEACTQMGELMLKMAHNPSRYSCEVQL